MKRYIILLAAVLIQVCVGGLYAWSSFVPALHASYGLSTAQTQFIFGGLIAVFTISMVYAGRLLNRRGPRLVASIGGILFGVGYLVGSFSHGSFSLLLLGISLVAGVGTGFCYVCPLVICVKWFPTRKGLVTGIAVAGFGGGAVLLASLAEVLFSQDWDVLAIFRLVGLFYGAAILAAATVLESPPAIRERTSPIAAPALHLLWRDRSFWGLALGMFCGTFSGLLVIGNLKPLALSCGIAPGLAATAISLFALGNAVGRIIWGWVADRLGPWAITSSLALTVAALSLLGLVCAAPTGLLGASFLVGFCFGACFVVYAAQVSSRYGPDGFGSVYPLVFLAYGLSGIVGPWIGGWLYDATGRYAPAIMVSLAVVAIGLGGSSWLLRKTSPKDIATTLGIEVESL
ncbi:MAG TPA: MFS transporter [Sedimentisphaerales bacterium]|nr:MFS transporter [Sedimentisphaerales bacterium]